MDTALNDSHAGKQKIQRMKSGKKVSFIC